MPHSRHLTKIITEVVMYVGMFAIVGHMCQNLCERIMIQSELKMMKTDLSSLGIVVTKIGTAYEILRDEIQCMLDKQLLNYSITAPPCFPSQRHTCLHCLQKKKKMDATENTSAFIDDCIMNKKHVIQQCSSLFNAVSDDTTYATLESFLNCYDYDKGEKNETEKAFCKCMIECVSTCSGKHYKVLNFQNKDSLSSASIQSSADAIESTLSDTSDDSV